MLEQYERLLEKQQKQRIKELTTRQCDEHQYIGWDEETCFECGVDIPVERVKIGRVMCIDCQTEIERIEKNDSRK